MTADAEVQYLRRAECARSGTDIVFRHSKLGLRLAAAQMGAIDLSMTRGNRDAA